MILHPPHIRILALPALLLSASTLAGCATTSQRLPEISLDDAPPALEATEPPRAVEVVAIPEPLPLPGQLRALNTGRPPNEPGDPRSRVGAANAAARIEPVRDGFINAIQLYPWTEGALYQVYAAPGQVTDIALQEGEQLVGAGPVAAGDTARWIIGDTVSGAGASARVHILVKPTRADLVTNLVINTDRRTYHLELRATASTYMASVSWRYPQDDLIALRRQGDAAAAAAPIAAGVDIGALNFRYALRGDNPPWRPVRVFDDGNKVYIEFPSGIGRGDMPPLFVVGAGGTGELVNYRVSGRHMIVDRLFAAAELRLGDRRSEQRVRISREDGRGRR
ncbi:MAG: P-type conjugative transfer protein TrbG [Altererythrobacter sp.]|mgnify:CR=1 FL=1|nr:P-type conjugative transfer protein TrbG [Altererythrobacter sp.]